ncbi:hypothetical protein [Maritimibacter sp. DP1N21-5]|uniref:hypothetical protein n=1 Tax=Maritimibacter sp. DP1N21-5 TaxID=2836867 RepID=UPI001C483A84|nr:hypothetical protein [Maritimibacter sp. DP1N21-5]MBV7408719.1 hypothetical protein [Maritimibacter sp. DP1N21-5]
MTQAYPLQWPDGWPRTNPLYRDNGHKFQRGDWKGGYKATTINDTRIALAKELEMLGARNVVLSTNVEIRLDGEPYSGRRAPDDPGIAVYFTLDGEAMVMAQDAYQRVPDNIRSLTLAISGMRQMQRHGGGTMLKRAFAGFTALPPPGDMSPIVTTPPRMWWEVLGVAQDCPLAVAEAAWKALARITPENDRYDINAAIEAARNAKRSNA